MSIFIDALDSINSAAIWDELIPMVPLIVNIFLFVFGFLVIRHILKQGYKAHIAI